MATSALARVSPATIFGRPGPDHVWLGPVQSAAVSFALRSQARRRTAILLGPRGCGKSTVLDTILQNIPGMFFRIRGQWDSGAALLSALVERAGLKSSGDAGSQREALATYLRSRRSSGQITSYAVDDAEHLSADVWHELYRLRMIDLDGEPPYFILVGRPSMQAGLESRNAGDWARLCMAVHVMAAPSYDDINTYVLRRLHAVRVPVGTFPTGTRALIAKLSEGSFKRVNLLCQASLLLAGRRGSLRVDEELVLAAQAMLGRRNDSGAEPTGARKLKLVGGRSQAKTPSLKRVSTPG